MTNTTETANNTLPIVTPNFIWTLKDVINLLRNQSKDEDRYFEKHLNEFLELEYLLNKGFLVASMRPFVGTSFKTMYANKENALLKVGDVKITDVFKALKKGVKQIVIIPTDEKITEGTQGNMYVIHATNKYKEHVAAQEDMVKTLKKAVHKSKLKNECTPLPAFNVEAELSQVDFITFNAKGKTLRGLVLTSLINTAEAIEDVQKRVEAEHEQVSAFYNLDGTFEFVNTVEADYSQQVYVIKTLAIDTKKRENITYYIIKKEDVTSHIPFDIKEIFKLIEEKAKVAEEKDPTLKIGISQESNPTSPEGVVYYSKEHHTVVIIVPHLINYVGFKFLTEGTHISDKISVILAYEFANGDKSTLEVANADEFKVNMDEIVQLEQQAEEYLRIGQVGGTLTKADSKVALDLLNKEFTLLERHYRYMTKMQETIFHCGLDYVPEGLQKLYQKECLTALKNSHAEYMRNVYILHHKIALINKTTSK